MLREVRTILLDISTAPLPNAAEFVDVESIKVPKNYVDPVKIEAFKADALAEKLAAAALDFDLARITGVGWIVAGLSQMTVTTCDDSGKELAVLCRLVDLLKGDYSPYRLVSYNGLAFDWPMLMRRARYLGVPFPIINCDRYKSPHVDLMALLTAHDPSRRKSLGFYVKRLGMGLTKPLSGAEEAQVPVSGRWEELEASLRHDVEALHKLASWLGVL